MNIKKTAKQSWEVAEILNGHLKCCGNCENLIFEDDISETALFLTCPITEDVIYPNGYCDDWQWDGKKKEDREVKV